MSAWKVAAMLEYDTMLVNLIYKKLCLYMDIFNFTYQ